MLRPHGTGAKPDRGAELRMAASEPVPDAEAAGEPDRPVPAAAISPVQVRVHAMPAIVAAVRPGAAGQVQEQPGGHRAGR